MYIGEFVGLSQGPTFERTNDKTGQKEDNPQMRWKFRLYALDGKTEIIDAEAVDEDGNPTPGQAIGEGLTSEATGIGRNGVKAKARLWLEVLCKAAGSPFDPDEDPMDEAARCVGTRALLLYGNNTQGKPGKLLSLSDAPA
jgi:hypothetical protein